MRDQDLVQSTYNELVDIYGEERVVVEPALEGKLTFRPDLAVLDDDQDEFYLIVEISALTTQHREREDLKQLRRLMQETGASFGALVSNSLSYIFELVSVEGDLVERELPSFPGEDKQGRRALESAEEIRFKLWRLGEKFREIDSYDLVNRLYTALFRKLAAERHDYNLNSDNLSEQDLDEIDQLLREEYPPFTPRRWEDDVRFQKHVLNLFNGIDLEEIPPHLAQVFVELGDKEKSGYQSTPLWLSESLVDLAEIQEGDLVLDPAAGFGNVAREASLRGAESYAVEINVDAANGGIFLNELFNTNVSYTLCDYFELENYWENGDDIPDKFNYAFIDPPFNLQYEREDGSIGQAGDEKFVLDTLERMEPRGLVTVILPAGKLFKQRASDFRDRIRYDYSLKSIIELNSPIHDNTSVSTVILQIANERPSEKQEVPYAVIDSGEDPEKKLPEVIDDIRLEKADSIPLSRFEGQSFLPSEITQLDKTSQELHEQYAEVRELQEVAEDIRGGTRKPQEVFESPAEDRLPYVNISDINQGGFTEYLRKSDEVVAADETDVLLSVTGSKIHVHHPSEKMAPSSMWAVIRFTTEEEALVYAHFLDSELARNQLESMQGGATIMHIPIRRLREVLVPDFSDEETKEKAEAIREQLARIKDLERERSELEHELEDLLGG